MWLEGFEKKKIGLFINGSSYVKSEAPFRGILHTTEGMGSIESLTSYYKKSKNYPHFTIDPWNRRKAQHIGLDRSATTSKNKPGGVETNRLNSIQIEIIGYADDTSLWTPLMLDWIGHDVIGPISEATGITLRSPVFVGRESGTIATEHAAQRMSYTDWYIFNGWCGHQHVPENDHWDPGKLNISIIFKGAQRYLNEKTPPVVVIPIQEIDMPDLLITFTGHEHVFARYRSGRVAHLGGGEFSYWSGKVPVVNSTDEEEFQRLLSASMR